MKEYRESLALFRELLRERPTDPAFQEQMADVLDDLASVEGVLGNYAAVFAAHDEALQLRTRLAESGNLRDQYALGRSRMLLGLSRDRRGEDQIALQDLEAAQKILERVRPQFKAMEVEKSLANCLIGIGHVHWDSGRPLDGENAYREAIAIRERLLAVGPFPVDRAELARAYGSLGQALSAQGRQEEALVVFRKSLEMREILVAANPVVTAFCYDLALSYKQVADELDEMSQLDEVFQLREKALTQLEIITRKAPENVDYAHALGIAHASISYVYRKHKNQPARAEAHLQAATDIWEDLIRRGLASKVHRFGIAQGISQIGLERQQAADYERAMDEFFRSNLVLEELLRGDAHNADYRNQLTVNLANTAYCQQMLGRLDEALGTVIKILRIREELARTYPQVAEHRRNLKKTQEDLESLAMMMIDKRVPLAPEATSDQRLAAETARLGGVGKNGPPSFPTCRISS